VLDLVDEHVEPGPLRDRLYAHWYRTKLLGRVGGPAFLRREPGYGRELYGEIRRLALERFGEESESHLAFPTRLRASLLRADRVDGLETLARLEGGLRARVRLLELETGEAGVELRLRAGVFSRAVPLRFARRGERILLVPPDDLAGALPEDRLDATKPVSRSKVDVMLRSPKRAEFLVRAPAELELAPAEGGLDGEVEPVLAAHVAIDAGKAAAGRPLDPGDWELHVRVTVAGFQAEAPIRCQGSRTALVIRVPQEGAVRVLGIPSATLKRRLVFQLARARRALRRGRSRSAV
jgi:poly(ribitol-phosphate) beta-N-acetylglucosaminyltransferase